MLSIIIPTYNSNKTIIECLNSVIALDKYKVNYEVILVDDGSIDGTRHINRLYAAKFPNIFSIVQNHSGVSIARNHAIQLARGSWICFLDSDDTINARHLVILLNMYANNNNDIIISNINRNNKLVGVKHLNISSIKTFIHNNYPIYKKFTIMDLSGKLYKSSVIQKYKISFPAHITIGEDFIFTLRFLNHMNKEIVQSPISFYNYYINSKSSVSNYDKQSIKNRIKLFYTIKDTYRHFHLSFEALNWIKLEMVYSILLNDLRAPTSKIDKIFQDKRKLNNLGFITYKNIKLIYLILVLMAKQPSTLLLFSFLKFIDCLRKIKKIY